MPLSVRAPFYALLLGSSAWLVLHPAPPTPRLGGAAPPLCAAPGVPVEERGQGLRCLSRAQADREGAHPGDVRPVDLRGHRAAGPPARMLPQRWLAAQVPLDPNQATLEELGALPELGPALAARILAARPLRSRADLARVSGIGPRRAARLTPLLRLPDKG